MRYVYPSYYPRFQCVGGKCPDTCCAGWEIAIDDRSLLRYRDYPGSFGNRLANSVDFEKKSFKQYGRRCVFLNEDNLCDIYIESGKDMMCRTCRDYPRHVEEYENIRELSLSLSCPEAARLILSQDRMELICMESQGISEDYGDFDRILILQLMDARQMLFRIIQDGTDDIYTRMMMILSMSHHLQRCVSEGDMSEMERVYRRYLRAGAGVRCRKYMLRQWRRRRKVLANRTEPGRGNRKMTDRGRFWVMKRIFHCLYRLEALSRDWQGIVRYCEKQLFNKGPEHYASLRKWKIPEKLHEQILNYFIYVYFAGAVYDRRAYVKVKLAVVSAMIIEDMLYVTAADKGEVTMDDCIDAAHRYGREVEHSDANLERMEGMLSHEECFHILNLTAALDER